MTKNIVFAMAVALTSQACVSEDEPETNDVQSEIGIPGGGGRGNHFYFAAYSKVPYIYKGCPDPGPEPIWKDKAVLQAKRGEQAIELELGSAVALDVRARFLPAGVTFKPDSKGGTLTVSDAAGLKGGITLAVSHLRCTFDVHVDIAYQ